MKTEIIITGGLSKPDNLIGTNNATIKQNKYVRKFFLN